MTTVFVILLFLIGWDVAWYLAGVKPLFPWQLKKFLKSKKAPISLIDVRTRWEYNWFHINGAANRPDLLYDLEALHFQKVSGHRFFVTFFLRMTKN